MTCARTGEAAGVRALLARGANVNAKEPGHDQTALMWAAAQAHPEAVDALLRGGADVRARSRSYVADRHERGDAACRPRGTELHRAARRKHGAALRRALRRRRVRAAADRGRRRRQRCPARRRQRARRRRAQRPRPRGGAACSRRARTRTRQPSATPRCTRPSCEAIWIWSSRCSRTGPTRTRRSRRARRSDATARTSSCRRP